MAKRIILLLLIVVSVVIPASAQMEKGMKSLGVKAGYATINRSGIAGLQFEYAFSRHFVLAPGIDYVFRNDNLDGMLFNLDYHGPWTIDKSGRLNVYHILGINYGSWSTHAMSSETADGNDDDVTTRYSHVGIDFGLGLSYFVKPTMKLTFEGKFNWLKHHNTGLFYLGVAYVF